MCLGRKRGVKNGLSNVSTYMQSMHKYVNNKKLYSVQERLLMAYQFWVDTLIQRQHALQEIAEMRKELDIVASVLLLSS